MCCIVCGISIHQHFTPHTTQGALDAAIDKHDGAVAAAAAAQEYQRSHGVPGMEEWGQGADADWNSDCEVQVQVNMHQLQAAAPYYFISLHILLHIASYLTSYHFIQASDCVASDSEDVTCCYSCSVVMHENCATRRGQYNIVNAEWLCVICYAEHTAKQ